MGKRKDVTGKEKSILSLPHRVIIIPDMKKYKALNLIKLMSKEERKNKKQCETACNVSE